MGEKYKHIETAVIHEGYDSKQHLGSLAAPIFQTSTFVFDTAEQGERRFAGEEEGYIYSRLGNPTVKALEDRIAVLEGAEAGLAFASGMAAVSAVLLALTKANDHIICSQGLYGCTFGLLKLMKEKYNIDHDFCEMKTADELEAIIRPETTCIYIETPINPTMKMIDLELVAAIAHKHGIAVVVDNTFSTPYLQKPLDHGCDIVLHSATKYICGHGDVIAGLAAGKQDLISQVAKSTLKDIGGILSPFDAWLLLRGLKTLPVRMDRHSENAERIFQMLKKEPMIDRVYYPGDTEHPDYLIMEKQMKQGGGLISFEVKGTKADAQRLLNELKLIKIAVSLGDAETLIQHPATMTHAVVPEQSRLEMGITDQLVRLSVGLENWEDLWDDLKRALTAVEMK
ncbi:methionine gamma-lyase [Peribacillus psychrosaccharolyticus]|uniref:L-methionine gamma-lyase n=1 Tax=Peribacillus psychrosaccharolyticus TaxID=1407 RepID=A0A974S2A2_PERPY|nr:methionine gamma-lyase [Peribacillus psychrosaccharolyticus]MEC2057068.1 methionine gamma-lyase [Peribacillus psychrosaccharolyticus]MED3744990.1 methionine gamma-lyase [Peribacillus psychrosaccharolyticus]QQT02394.1 methionine gamma-lyase [Peribacillus psychrosaccharolyticus]